MANFAEQFELLLFHRTVACDRECLKGGVNGLVIDFETRGKIGRQSGFDTEINAHSMEDLRRVKGDLGAYVMCRVNPPGPPLGDEIGAVIEEGVDEVMVPMIRTVAEAEMVVGLVGDQCKASLMIETIEATKVVRQLTRLPLHRLYLGLNDLHISRGSPSIFSPLGDGLLHRIRSQITGVKFGFAGLTLPELGSPLPVRYLINEMARLDCSFSFLRRSFYRDIAGCRPETEIVRIREELHRASLRPAKMVEEESAQFQSVLSGLVGA